MSDKIMTIGDLNRAIEVINEESRKTESAKQVVLNDFEIYKLIDGFDKNDKALTEKRVEIAESLLINAEEIEGKISSKANLEYAIESMDLLYKEKEVTGSLLDELLEQYYYYTMKLFARHKPRNSIEFDKSLEQTRVIERFSNFLINENLGERINEVLEEDILKRNNDEVRWIRMKLEYTDEQYTEHLNNVGEDDLQHIPLNK